MSSSLKRVLDITGKPVSLQEVRRRLADGPPPREFSEDSDCLPLVRGKRAARVAGAFIQIGRSGQRVSSVDSLCRILPPLF